MLHIYLSDLPLFMESDILNELFKSKYPVTYEITKKNPTFCQVHHHKLSISSSERDP